MFVSRNSTVPGTGPEWGFSTDDLQVSSGGKDKSRNQRARLVTILYHR